MRRSNLKGWLEWVAQNPKARIINYQGKFRAVLCGSCGKVMTSPFHAADYWELWHLIKRRWNTCEHCGVKNRLFGAIEERVDEDV